MTAEPRPEVARVGDYELLVPIGEGGMGVVHLARGADGRRVALKLMRPQVVADAEARERLEREIRSLRRISSPHVAEILDADAHGHRPYVVTRYVPGLSLYRHVREEGLVTGADLPHFVWALSEALHAVHQAGVLHRDIKPTNVIMEGRSPVLIDFGLARVAEDPRLTQAGWLFGTPGYLAPEILYGDHATVSSDVHAWAATVAVAATGRPPYGNGPTMAVLDRVRRGEHDLTGVPEPLASLLRACLATEPHDRPTVGELRQWVVDHGGAPRPRRAAEPAGGGVPMTMPMAHDGPPATGGLPAEGSTMPEGVQEAAPPPSSLGVPLAPPPVGAPVPAPLAPPPVPPREPVAPREPAGWEYTSARLASPYQEPPPPRTSLLPQQPGRGEPWGMQSARPLPSMSSPTARWQQRLQLAGLGLAATALVAYAPYAGGLVVALALLALRTISVTRQRHSRRRWLRGRSRWYDVPATTLSLPGYLLLASFGVVALVVVGAMVAFSIYAIGTVFHQQLPPVLLVAAAGFVATAWWGPGSSRVREVTRGFAGRMSRTEFGGWFVAGAALLAAAVVLGLLLGTGVNWAPALTAPLR